MFSCIHTIHGFTLGCCCSYLQKAKGFTRSCPCSSARSCAAWVLIMSFNNLYYFKLLLGVNCLVSVLANNCIHYHTLKNKHTHTHKSTM